MGPSKQMKQIVSINFNSVKNVRQLAGGKTAYYLKGWQRVWTGDYREQIQLAVRAGLELEASELQV